MSEWPEVPSFGAELAKHISSIPAAGQPAFLAGLERSAAARYRHWAAELPDHAEVLNACAAREDEIASLVADLFPIPRDVQDAVDRELPAAVETYYEVFAPHPTLHQLFLQSEAELQGSQAWVGIAAGVEDAGAREILARCTALEEESSRAVKELLAKIA